MSLQVCPSLFGKMKAKSFFALDNLSTYQVKVCRLLQYFQKIGLF